MRNKSPQNDTPDDDLSPVQLQVLGLLMAGQSVSEAAASVGVDRGTIYRWMREDDGFEAEHNRLKAELREGLYRRLRNLHEAAIASFENLLVDQTTPPAVRLRAASTVLELTSKDGLYHEKLGPTSPEGVRRQRERQRVESEVGREWLRQAGINPSEMVD